MLKIAIKAENAPRPVAKYSQAIRLGDTLYVQGMIALDPKDGKIIDGGIEDQARRVFESISSILDSAGMVMENVVKVTAFLSNLGDYPKFNDIYNLFFDTDIPPVRTTVQAELPLGACLEIEIIAYANTHK